MMYQPDPFFEAESVGPAVTFGAEPPSLTHEQARIKATLIFKSKFGHDIPQNLAEATWLQDLVMKLKKEAGVPKTGPGIRGAWGWKDTAALGAIGLTIVMVLRPRRRRRNPRTRMLPLLAIGGVGALLWYGARRTVAVAEQALTPKEQGGVVTP